MLEVVRTPRPAGRRLVLTGGPCAGKTTALSRIKAVLEGQGMVTVVVPEAATELIEGGHVFDFNDDPEHNIALQTRLLAHQLDLEWRAEQEVRALLTAGVPPDTLFVLYDRGIVDDRAYMSAAEWDSMLARAGLSLAGLLGRYDLVFHLVTSALADDPFYSSASNPARYETAERAAELDHRLRAAWAGHGRVRLIENPRTGGFEAKMAATLAAVAASLAETAAGGQAVGPPGIKKALRAAAGARACGLASARLGG